MTRAIKKYSRDFIALVVLFLIAIGVSGYIIYNQEARPSIPLLEAKPKSLKFEFSDAQAVTPGQGQAVRVAGVQVGKIVGVEPRNGLAVVETEIEPKWWDKIKVKEDATGLLRPRTGLKDMFIELDPGLSGDRLGNGDTVPVENTAPDIDPDEVLAAFDQDTRTYLQLLINGAGKGLKNRGDDLNKTFKALGPTQRDLNRVTSAIGDRREALKELIQRYGSLTNTLAEKDKEIRTLITASNAVFKAFASQEQNISLAVSRLPSTLAQTERTLTKANAYARLLRPTLNELRPSFRQLDTTNRQVLPFALEAEPIIRTRIRPFVRTARPYVRNLKPAARNLARATPDFTATFYQLNRFFNMGAFNKGGSEGLFPGGAAGNRPRDEGYLYWLAWTVMNTDSMFSTSDALGPFRRALFGLSCDSIKAQLTRLPAAGPLLGLSNAINDPVLCGSPTGEPLPDLGLPLPKKGGKVAGEDPPAPPAPNAPAPEGEQPAPAPDGTTPTVPNAPETPAVPEVEPDDAAGALPLAGGKP